MKNHEYNQLLLSAKIGDGCYITGATEITEVGTYTYYVNLVAKQLDYLMHKKAALEELGIFVRKPTLLASGYKKGAFSYSISTRIHPLLTAVGNLSVEDCVAALNKQGIVYYYLDDGTYHQKKHFMHLYCNSFTLAEVAALINKLYELYPISKAKLRWDCKKDGRKYPYLYIPVAVANVIKEDVKAFLNANNITSLMYKTGSPSTTIENRS